MLLMVNVFYHVGAGSARPNTSTYVFVGAFGQANPAPTVDCCNLPLPMGGRFRSLQFAAPSGRTVSQPAICRSQREDSFAACNLPLPAGGRFRGLHFRKVSIIGGFGNISAEKIGFGKRIFCFAVGLSGKNKSAGAGNGAAADSV